ncbi:hypothetical protein M9H77_17549 [Catharanthus roseus]|uniref:Uncharacterized protein n=1 Tax=Catharanthus roseus TaxID=4058 RepID=A0ACC0B4W5_CATRO|nr:hypothetical protein M9H77_17549 [Catharanthus roseus]
MKVSMECEGVAEEGGSKRGKFRVEGTEKAVIMRKEKVVEDAGAELVMGCEGEEVTWALVPLHMDVEPCIQECSYAVGGKRKRKGQRPFRFEMLWMHDEECKEKVIEAWPSNDYNGFDRVSNKFLLVAHNLKEWSKEKYGLLECKLIAFKKEIDARQEEGK